MFKQALCGFIALSSLNGVAAAQTAAPAVSAQPPTCALPSVADSVALEDVPDSELKTVPVTINGAKKKFLLDISTNLTEVSPATVSQLSLPDVRNSPSDHITPYAGTDTYGEQTAHKNFDMNVQVAGSFLFTKSANNAENIRPHVHIASLGIGDAIGHNLTFVVAKDDQMGKVKSQPYDGLMTGDFFKQYDIELDFAGNKLNYLTPTTCPDPLQVAFWPHAEVAVIPMTIEDDGKIHVQVTIQGHLINAVIDTSFEHTVMRRGVAERTLGYDASKMTPDGSRVDGMGQQIYLLNFPQISFAGGVTAINVPARIQNYSLIHDVHRTPVLGSRATFSVTPDIADLTLGMDVLEQLHLYIAPGQKNIYATAAG